MFKLLKKTLDIKSLNTIVYSKSNNDLLQNRSNKSIFFSNQTKAINSIPEYEQRVCSQNNKFYVPHARPTQIHKAMASQYSLKT